MKLSKAQQAVIDEAKRDIDRARSYSRMIEWYMADGYWQRKGKSEAEVIEYLKGRRFADGMTDYDYYMRRWQDEKNGIVAVHANSKTLYKLQEMGMIEIIRDSKGETFGIDTIKLLNY